LSGGAFRAGRLTIVVAVVLGLSTGALGAEAAFGAENGLLAYIAGGDCDVDELGPDDVCPDSPYLEQANPRQPNQRRALTSRTGSDLPGNPVWSPNGRLLLYDKVGDEVLVSRRDGSADRVVLQSATEPAWSPTGREVVFTRDVSPERRGSFDPELFVRGFRGGVAKRITRGGGSQADWSSRDEVAFSRFGPSGPHLYVARPNGTGLRRLAHGASAEHPSWSPGGALLAIERKVGPRDNIVVIDRRGRHIRTLTRKGGTDPTWSPNGRRIAFTRRSGLYTVSAYGGGLRRILPGVTAASVDWQPRPVRR
jgi:Tol biopolymer transport system component